VSHYVQERRSVQGEVIWTLPMIKIEKEHHSSITITVAELEKIFKWWNDVESKRKKILVETIRTKLPNLCMSKEAVIQRLNEIAINSDDKEINHALADKLLLAFINDEEITAAYNKIEKWYA
jgi:hypothetical protein